MANYHFIAIGGIGMSGLAKYLLEQGHRVSGSDISDSKYINKLRELGAEVNIGHKEDNLPNNTDFVVISTAIKDSNPELIKAKNLGLKIYHRSDLLEQIASVAQENNKCFIGFAGTHGKTTTSGLASFVLDKAGLNPAFVVGGIVPEISTNAQHKSGKFFVAELDESDGTLVKYNPDILVINNLEEDHLDFYKNGMADIIKVFNQAISQSKKVIINSDDKGIQNLKGDFITFGLNDADYTAKNIQTLKNGTIFEVFYKNEYLTSVFTQLSGKHNIYNNLAVIAALNEADLTVDCKKEFFAEFTGMGRRFQKICEISGINVYDDYAHHPTEIKAVLDGASQKYGKENIIAVFQPHRYTRLQALWNDFKFAFDNASRVIVTDVYEASEIPIDGITGKNFASEANFEHISGSIENVAEKLLPSLKSGNIVIGLGAGTITNLGKLLKELSLANRV